MAANIDAEIREIQSASRGEQVRDAIVDALIAINDSDGSATREMVTQIVNAAIGALDVASVGGNGKYIKSISEADGKITAVEDTLATQATQNSNKPITSGAVYSVKETLQSNFQDGVDSIYDAVVAKGSTPASHSLSDVVEGIEAIETGGTHVIEHTDNWAKNYNMGPMYFNSYQNLWTDGEDLYYSDAYSDCKFNKNTQTFEPIQITVDFTGDYKFTGNDVFYDGSDVYMSLRETGRIYIFNKQNMVFKMISSPNTSTGSSLLKPLIWTDGDYIYYSYGTNEQYVYDKNTGIWSTKVWIGLKNFYAYDIWTDGTNIYYSRDTDQYILDKSTSTWSVKTWSGYSSIYGRNIWTDGTDIYYSNGSTQYVLNQSVGVWYQKTWYGLTSYEGYYTWTDGDNIYLSNGSSQYVLDKSTSTWSAKTWGGLSSFKAENIWTDGTDIYFSDTTSYQRILNKSTSTWETVTWSGPTDFYGRWIWNDGENIYYSYGSTQYIIDTNLRKVYTKRFNFYQNYIWTDGTDIYYSSGTTHYVFDKDLSAWSVKTWIGMTNFQAYYIWTDGENIYHSYNSNQWVLDVATSTWTTKTWSGINSFSGNYIKNINGNIYYSTSAGSAYLLDKAGSAWNLVSNWNQTSMETVFECDGTYYSYNNYDDHYIYNSVEDSWISTVIYGPCYLAGINIWTDGENIYYSNGSKQFVLDKATHTWVKKQWSGITNIIGQYVWTDGENIYYSRYDSSSYQYVLNKEYSLWYQKVWTGLTAYAKAYVWNDGESIYYTDGQKSYKLEASTT